MFKMHNEACALCLTTNKRNIIINNTCLQPVYEKLADLKIDNISCWMCFICHRRLQQCHRLWKLAEHTRSVLVGSILGVREDKIEAIFASKKSLLELSPSKQINICIESTVHVGEDLELNVNREPSADVVETQHADTDDRTARRGSDEQSYKQSSCDDDPVQDNKDIFEAKDDQLLEFVQSEGINEEYVQENMTADRSFEETATGFSYDTEDEEEITVIVVSEDLTSPEETLLRPKELKLEIKKLEASFISKYIGGYVDPVEDFTCGHPRVRGRAGDACEKPISCDISQRKFSQKGQLKGHLSVHIDEKPFSCGICQRKFSLRGQLKVHLRVHRDEKRFSCDICHRKFFHITNLQKHLRIHRDEKSFSCHICQRKFSQRSHLKVHLRVHTGEKPFSCDICQNKFSQKGTLNDHLRVHVGEKPFSCDICQRKFSKRSTLTDHLRVHTGEKPFSCDICQRKFSRRGTLTDHLRVHTGEKPFGCYICQRKFSLRSSFNEHLRVHMDEKPFGCDICQRKFSQRGQLRKHLKVHSDNKIFFL